MKRFLGAAICALAISFASTIIIASDADAKPIIVISLKQP